MATPFTETSVQHACFPKMSEDLKKRLEFPNSLIQTQAVTQLIASVLKENVSLGKIKQSSNQTPALNILWEKCCSNNVVVRTACCEALVLLVEQDHADFDYVLNGILNLIPSAGTVQGLLKCVWRLLYTQARNAEKDGEHKDLGIYKIWVPQPCDLCSGELRSHFTAELQVGVTSPPSQQQNNGGGAG
ncbi:focadhesin [Xenopus tropicalis]|uniref:Focadhesin n=1 Tax=Xenopus tropicalis TaxID=8364 RepID=Q28FU9_XENTR|nr:focadhesin isoform 1 [Xenopus tropicalis]CAJ83904.1 novel protein [Xenopus tropicalis]|eukprot:NP_001016255.2 focadhesin [Xenopus tropicalis]